MRKAIFIFIAVILVAMSIDWIHSCADLKSHKEVFSRHLTYANMYEYKDKDYDYVVRVPPFFNAQLLAVISQGVPKEQAVICHHSCSIHVQYLYGICPVKN